MGTVTALFAQKVAGILDPSADRAALLAPLGLHPTAAPDPAHRVPAADYYAFLERVVAA